MVFHAHVAHGQASAPPPPYLHHAAHVLVLLGLHGLAQPEGALKKGERQWGNELVLRAQGHWRWKRQHPFSFTAHSVPTWCAGMWASSCLATIFLTMLCMRASQPWPSCISNQGRRQCRLTTRAPGWQEADLAPTRRMSWRPPPITNIMRPCTQCQGSAARPPPQLLPHSD